jgi:hypothetical protein
MRPSQTDPGPATTKARPEGWSRDTSQPPRAETADGGELRDRPDQAGPRPGDGATAGTWHEIKSRFVDDPAGAIAAAEDLVRQAVDDKVRALQAEAAALCAREHGEGESSTETLRTRLIRYQGYCERLGGSSVH